MSQPSNPSKSGEMPSSTAAEKGILCSMLLDPDTVAPLCTSRLPVDAFYLPAHQIIYSLALELIDNGGSVDFVSVKQALKDAKELEEIGGVQYLSDLYSFVPSAANAEHYIRIVLAKRLLRRLIQTCEKVSSRCREQQAEPSLVLIEAEQEISQIIHSSNGDIWTIESGTNLLVANTPLPPELIHGLLHKTLKAELAGGSKTMKSWALIDLALSVSLGTSWWGFETTKARVLFLNLEIPRPFFRARLAEVVFARKLKLDPNTLLVQHLRGFDLSRREVWERLMREIVRRGPWDLLVLDPIYKMLGSRDENNASDVTEILMSLECAAELTGAAVLFSHHYAKGSAALKESTDRMSGSGVWMRDPDSYLAMTRHEVGDCFTVEPTLRNLAPIKPFVMRWTHPVFTRAPDLDPEELRQPRKPGPANKFDVHQIVTALNGDTLSTPQLKKRVVEETGMSRSKFYELLSQADKRKLLVKDGQTGTWERPELDSKYR